MSQTAAPVSGSRETLSFQAETRKLLDLVIHSLYSNREIFLRELISNASDAIDRRRFEALTDPALAPKAEAAIRIEADAEARTLTIADDGIGMSRSELVENIGTIARSGTRELVEKLKAAKTAPDGHVPPELIGQFGVGFYSSFMVADRVRLVTRRAGEEGATRWESDGTGEFTIEDGTRSEPGTTIVLDLKPADKDAGLDDFTNEFSLKRVIRRYSDFVTHPVILKTSREESETDENGQPKPDAPKKRVVEEATVNSRVPLWARAESEIKEEDHAEFYRHIAHDWSEPLLHMGLKAEGRFEYQALLYVPGHAPYDLFYVGYEPGLQLYVKRVLIMERCEALLPRYLRFLKGVVDSPDLPLNVSREMLQDDRMIRAIQKGLVKKVLDTLTQLKANDAEKYGKFWSEFGRAIKEGVAEDFENKDKLTALLLFESSHHASDRTSLADYVARMKDSQREIFYLTGESRGQVEASPHLEAFRDKGYEVLYLIDPVDELLVQYLTEFEGKKLKSVGKGTVDLGDEAEREAKKEELEKQEEGLKTLLESLQKELDEHVKQVRLSTRLTTSPACLVGAEHDYSPQLEKLLQKGKGGGAKQRRILELNGEHPIVARLGQRFPEAGPEIAEYAQLLFGYALLAEGSELPDPARFNRSVADLMVKTL